jgi:hypothetical protein
VLRRVEGVTVSRAAKAQLLGARCELWGSLYARGRYRNTAVEPKNQIRIVERPASLKLCRVYVGDQGQQQKKAGAKQAAKGKDR